MHQFGWISERERVTFKFCLRKRRVPSEKKKGGGGGEGGGDSNPGEIYGKSYIKDY